MIVAFFILLYFAVTFVVMWQDFGRLIRAQTLDELWADEAPSNPAGGGDACLHDVRLAGTEEIGGGRFGGASPGVPHRHLRVVR